MMHYIERVLVDATTAGRHPVNVGNTRRLSQVVAEPTQERKRVMATTNTPSPAGPARHRSRGIRLGIAALAVGTLVTACTATPPPSATVASDTPVTITFWHGWTLPQDVATIQQNIDAFEKLHPNITVVATSNVDDDKMTQGLRTSNGPDVVSSFTTDSVGGLCSSGALVDLNPMLAADNIDKAATFIPARLAYTQYKGVQCTLPLLGDAFALYYNTDMFTAAGISSPPKTWSEFTADAVKLTKTNNGSYDPVGFMPLFENYMSTPNQWMAQWSPTYLDDAGKSALAKDPNVSAFFQYTKTLVDALGGYAALDKYRATFGDEWSDQNAFEVGKVAMQMDGEWRIPIIKADGSNVNYAVAPLPVPDNQADTYGKSDLTGTMIGISGKSAHQAAAWEFVKFLTTDTQALVSFGNEIYNLPSTNAALTSPDLVSDPNFKVFLDIGANQYSVPSLASCNGGNYMEVLNRFAAGWESGAITDLAGGLADVDQQIDVANSQCSAG
jgi:multiple sugar transport system substrate-binding protein